MIALTSLPTPWARAMSVLPPTFDELVSESGQIIRGRVVSVEPFRTTSASGESIIKTRVTWLLLRTLKGTEADSLVLEFLGGRVGQDMLEVAGMPRFSPGDEEFLFVESNTRVVCPLIAAGHGRYRIKPARANQHAMVTRDNGVPLIDPAEVALPLHSLPGPVVEAREARALTPEEFEKLIEDSLRRTGGGDAR